MADEDLTDREKEILRLVDDGLTNEQMAAKLFISELTVETHHKSINHKFGTHNVAGTLKVGHKKGYLP